nr:hypothetical protein [Tanacetum cinerariifolium]
DPEEESTTSSIIPADTKSKNKEKGIMVEEPKPLKKKKQVEMDEDKKLRRIQLCKISSHEEKSSDKSSSSKEYDSVFEESKRRKLNEEVEDLKRHLEIVPDEDDDVYTEATPRARKVPVVDYEIINLNNKHYYKIIRANGTH